MRAAAAVVAVAAAASAAAAAIAGGGGGKGVVGGCAAAVCCHSCEGAQGGKETAAAIRLLPALTHARVVGALCLDLGVPYSISSYFRDDGLDLWIRQPDHRGARGVSRAQSRCR